MMLVTEVDSFGSRARPTAHPVKITSEHELSTGLSRMDDSK